MLSLLKKLFAKKAETAAPYKVEAPVAEPAKKAAKKPAAKKTTRKSKSTPQS